MASVADPDRVVPAPRWDGLDVCGAGTAHALATGPAVVFRHGRGEGLGTLVALDDILVRYPVVWPSNALHET